MSKDLKDTISKALNDKDLQQGMKKSHANFLPKREAAMSGFEIKKVQEEISSIKEKNLNQLNENIEQLKKSCEKNGTRFIEVKDKNEANLKIAEIINFHEGKSVVKGKSMVSEEIELNNFLEGEGIKVTETDLGEWLVQLAGEKPSHIVAPAIHMPKERITKLLNEKFNVNLKPDSKEITQFARKMLRKEFIEADIGFTGANLLVAETGSSIIVSNEGNGRLVSTLPNVHIILATPEKIVENMEEANKLLKILPRSATGVDITSYVSIISGPSKTADIEKELVTGVHGPEFVYLILLDNGRREMLSDPVFRDALKCIKCGACMTLCPVFQTIGGHAFGDKFPCGIGAIYTAFMSTHEDSKDTNALCSGCGICKTVCPAGIDIPAMILKQRKLLADQDLLSKPKEYLVKGLFFNKYLFDMALNTAGFFQKLLFHNQTDIDNLPEPLAELTSFRTLPKFAGESLKKRISKENIIQTSETKKEILGFFSGCLVDRFYPDEGIKAIKILQNLGYQVDHPEDQTCCGIPALYSGEVESYEKSLDENIKAFKNTDSKYFKGIFTLCPSCTYGIKKENSFKDTEVFDFSEFIYKNIDLNNLKVKDLKNITYHPSCHHSRNSYNQTYTHLILEQLYKENFIKYSDMYNCCGAAGSYAVEYPEISERIIHKKIENILSSRSETIVIDCPGCKMQIDGYIKKNNVALKTLFITDIFVE